MNIISFSLFGSEERYRAGLLKNLQIAPTVFPGWECVVYCDEFNFIALKDLSCPRARFILQENESRGLAGMTWRWTACRIEGAHAVIFRDTDSVLGFRERDAVEEWLTSPFDVHVIRDHPQHFSPVMGGMFGVRGPAIKLLADLVQRHLSSHRLNEYWDDQAFLNQYFYPRIKHTALVHTSSVRYLFEYSKQLRQFRDGELFIGAYEFASQQAQAQYLDEMRNTPPRTMLPYHWQDKRVLKLLYKVFRLKRIKYGCKWCI